MTKRATYDRANYYNTQKLSRTVENTTRYQFDPIGDVINLSKGDLQKRQFNFLTKTLNHKYFRTDI